MRHHRYRAHFDRSDVAVLYERVMAGLLEERLCDRTLVLRGARRELLGCVALKIVGTISASGPIGDYRFLLRMSRTPRETTSALLCAGRDWFQERGVTRFVAQTSTSNVGMIRTAKHVGFRERERVLDYFWWAP